MDQELKEKWFDMSVGEQISNIGSEVSRAITWKNKGNDKRKIGFCNKSIAFLELSMEDPKNKHRVGEFSFCIEKLKDFLWVIMNITLLMRCCTSIMTHLYENNSIMTGDLLLWISEQRFQARHY